MTRRRTILLGMVGGLVWSLALLWLGWRADFAPGLARALMIAFLLAALPLLVLIGLLAQRRFFGDDIIDGQRFAEGSGEEIDQRVLQNTVEQLVLAICIWPIAGALFGAGMVLALGCGFVIARGAFWLGYHAAPSLRAFGFAATFYPTAISAVLSLIVLLT